MKGRAARGGHISAADEHGTSPFENGQRAGISVMTILGSERHGDPSWMLYQRGIPGPRLRKYSSRTG